MTDDLGELRAHLVDDGTLAGDELRRGDWVRIAGAPDTSMTGRVKRLAADGSWADVDWGRWTKRMPITSLQVVATLVFPSGWRVTDMTRAAEIESEGSAGDGG